MTSPGEVVRALLAESSPPGLRAHGGSAVATSPNGNDLAIFVEPLRTAPSGQPEFILAYGVRLGVLIQFDRERLGIRHSRWPRLGHLHYERSLGWLLGQDEPVFPGVDGADAVASLIRPAFEMHVLADLEAHDSDAAVAESLLRSEPLTALSLDDLSRLQFLLSRLGTKSQQDAVAAALEMAELRSIASDRELIEDVNAEIARVTGARIVDPWK